MRATIGGTVFEGTPEEIAELQELLREAVPPRHSRGAAGLAELTDEKLIERFGAGVAVAPKTRDAYLAAVRKFKAYLGARALLDARPHDVTDALATVLGRCRHLYTFPEHSATPGWHRCEKGRFARSVDAPAVEPEAVVDGPGARPDFCREQCPMRQLSVFPAAHFISGVRRFYDFYADEAGRDPAARVARKFFEEHALEEELENRFCPPLELVTLLLRRAADIRAKTFIMVAAKTGRRPDEIRRLQWSMIDLERGVIDWEAVRREKRQAAGLGRVKMRRNACGISIIDEELAECLRTYRRACWSSKVRRGAASQPVTDYIWLGKRRSGPCSEKAMNGWLNGAIRDADCWQAHGNGAKDRLTPHCFRHFFTSVLRRPPNPLDRDFVKHLRGDTLGDAMERYEHYTVDQMREMYLPHMPRLG